MLRNCCSVGAQRVLQRFEVAKAAKEAAKDAEKSAVLAGELRRRHCAQHEQDEFQYELRQRKQRRIGGGAAATRRCLGVRAGARSSSALPLLRLAPLLQALLLAFAARVGGLK
jgi:hypothetical protein